ncbi:DNA primase [Nocardioides sp.]|uniref:DNA primase n=1 Tax=Nocardioides sp. TaxID=35761 RepID=UPI0035AF45C4
MAGRIRDDDIAEVREKARIDDVISGYVTLKRAGAGTLKGLCPFHDEKTPSFNVNPSRQFFHCFGCGEGGDVIAFLMKVDGLTFTETVERLAEKYGVQLRREDGDDEPQRPRGPARGRLIEAHKVAQEFYAEQLATADAVVARQFLHQRGFDQAAAATFGVGFAPRDGEALLRHLRGRRITDEESVAAGLVALGRSHYDRFRGRLVWPIREANGDTIGFGARRIFDDDRIEAKYLNTSETAIYKKSQVLYGIDLARTAMKDSQQAVVVEGYTDVMACHLAGVKTAVASCGTAFGTDHARVLRRFMGDHGTGGEVIFTFDGDSAGQKAAMKVLESDQVFASQTYVAVAPEGMDPCDLRLEEGDEAVRELVAKRQPLYRFALDNILARYDLDRADGRVDALRDAATLVASIRDKTKVESFSRELAHMVGMDVDDVRAEVRRVASRPAPRPDERRTSRAPEPAAAPEPPRPALPSLSDPRFLIERELLKLVVQHPASVGRTTTHVTVDDFTHPTFQGVWAAVSGAGGPAAGAQDPGWSTRVRGATTDPAVAAAITELGVEPVRGTSDPDPSFAVAYVYKLQERTTARRIADVKARLQRTNPVDNALDYNRMFGELVMLEQHRRKLQEGAVGQGSGQP